MTDHKSHDERVADKLRMLADDIESGDIAVTNYNTESHVRVHEPIEQTLTVGWCRSDTTEFPPSL